MKEAVPEKLLIMLHHQKVDFGPSDGYDAVPGLLCHITQSVFVIVADE